MDWPTSEASREERRGALIFVVLATFAFFSMWWNAYLSPVSGGELIVLQEYELGHLPYRDYYFSAQPFALLWLLAIFKIFGARLIAVWAVAILLRVVAAAVLFSWLAERVRPRDAALAVVTAAVVSSVDIADVPSWYQHQTIAFAIFGAFCVSRALTAQPDRRAWAWALGAGLNLAVSLMIKQTTGILTGAAVFATLLVGGVVLHGWRRGAGLLAWALGGFSLVVGATLTWLTANGLMTPYLEQVYLKGPSSKGGALMALLRPVTLTLRFESLWPSLLLAVLVVLTAVALVASAKSPPRALPWPLVALGAAGLALLSGQWALSLNLGVRTFTLACAYLSLLTGLLLSVKALRQVFQKHDLQRSVQWLLVGVVGFSTAYSMSLSWPAFEVMAFPGLAIALVLFLALPVAAPLSTGLRSVTMVAMFALVSVSTLRKHASPFSWGFWVEPPLTESSVEPKLPELQGFTISPMTAGFLESVVRDIQNHSAPGENIFVYPHMPGLYALSGRHPATFAITHWLDVCPDYVALADAERLKASPPAVIVSFDLPMGFYANEESLFRKEPAVGVRQLLAAMAELEPRYEVVSTYRAAGSGIPIRVLALKR